MSLGISLSVTRCRHAEHQRPRVRFVIGGRCRIGEDVVLRRWRDRSKEPTARARGITFEGCRLPPGTFQIIDACRADGFDVAGKISIDTLGSFYERARDQHKTWRAPSVANTVAILTCLARTKRLPDVLGRERSPMNPGLPDLFLWKRRTDGSLFGERFVEVKRRTRTWKEPLSRPQREEIAFLRSLDAKARVVYLLER